MLIAGYERQFSDSLGYWRTRFIMIPTLEPPQPAIGPSGEKLNDEETRLLGSDKLAQIFSSLVWVSQSERDKTVAHPPVRFIPTYLNPTACVVDEHLVAQLEEVQAAGPFGKKMKSERVAGGDVFACFGEAYARRRRARCEGPSMANKILPRILHRIRVCELARARI